MNYRYNPQIVGYTMIRKNRGTPTVGGGIAILKQNNIYFTELIMILKFLPNCTFRNGILIVLTGLLIIINA